MNLKEKFIYGTLVIFMLLILKVCYIEMNEPIKDYRPISSYYENQAETETKAVKKHYHKKTTKRKKIGKIKVVATMYNPVTSQCDNTPLITAGNYKINYWHASKHRWIAVSRDLLVYWGGNLKWGDKVKIKGAGHKNGIYTVVDTMNERFTNRIDFLETVGTPWYKYNKVIIEKV